MRIETSSKSVYMYMCGNVKQREFVKTWLERNHKKYWYVFVKDRFRLLGSQLHVAKFLQEELLRNRI